jgi:ABC-type glycerol-3-phosphate transport system permease component
MTGRSGLTTAMVIKKLFFYVALIAAVLFFMMPIYHFATMSIKTEVDAFASPPKWFFVPTI